MQIVAAVIRKRTNNVRHKLDEVLLGLKHPKVRRLMEKMATQGAKLKNKSVKLTDYDLTNWLAESILRRSESIRQSLTRSKTKLNKLRAVSNTAKKRVTKKIRKAVKRKKK